MADSPCPPVVLSFLAPASRCNQHCVNCYITEVAGEPVHSFDLCPADYALFVQQFLDAGIRVLSIKFQGYEVTLPQSWPYLEAVFEEAQRHNIRRSFITNGMLLHKWADRIRDLGVARITVSLDGATPEVNDRFRGLPGAFDATTRNVARFLEQAPEYENRIAVASLLRGTTNFSSLLQMPKVVRSLGVSHWIVSVELAVTGGRIRPLLSNAETLSLLDQLRVVSELAGVRFHASDENGALPRDQNNPLKIQTIPNPQFFYRIDPAGRVHTGRAIYHRWDPQRIPRWDPSQDNAVDTVRYWPTLQALDTQST